MSTLAKRVRHDLIGVVDALGQRERVSNLYGRFSISRRVRRDHLDMRLLNAVIAVGLGSGRTGVDVGANAGTVSAMMVAAAPTHRHILVEPVSILARRLEADFPSCEVIEAICGATASMVEFSVAVHQPTRSSVHETMAASGGPVERRMVSQVTLDELVGDRDVGMVKIDVEGAERSVLEGAARLLGRTRPLIVFEHQRSGPVDGAESRAIHELLARNRYEVFDIDGRGPLERESFVRIVDSGEVWSFMAVPADNL